MTYLIFVILILGLQAAHPIRTDARCVCKQWKLAFECGNDSDCIWNNNTKQCDQQLCSNIVSQSVCSSDDSCQYRNGKCEDFTKCADLQGKTINECRMMSTNCRETNGTNCLPTALERKCNQFTNEGECTQGHDGFCVWASDSCLLWNQCSQATTQIRCESGYLSCDWSVTLKRCLQLACSEITDEYSCYGVLEGPNSHLFQTCMWNAASKRCEESVPEILTFDTCQENTLLAYHWSESNPNEGYCEQCLSPNVQKPQPIHCLCDTITQELDCKENQSCQFIDGKCYQKQCKDIDPPQSCLQIEKCAWYGNQCVEFTDCANYLAHSNLECQSINKKCLISSNLETCTNKYVACSTHKTDDMCNGTKSSASQQCYWDDKMNSCSEWTQCSQQKQATYCDFSGACFWEEGECKQIQCKLLHENHCSHYLEAPNSSLWKYCMLLDTCKDLNAESLNKDQCYSQSYGISSWNSSVCKQCKIPENYSFMIQVFNNDNYSVDGWNIDEQANLIKYSKFGLASTILVYGYLLTITIIYKTQFPHYLQEIFLYLSIFGLVLSIMNLFWKQEEDNIVRQFCFVFDGLLILTTLALILFLLASYQADYDSMIAQKAENFESQKFTLLFYSIIVVLIISLIFYLYITYTLYLCQEQQNLMVSLHIFNSLLLFSGIIINHYHLNFILLALLIISTTVVYAANLKKIKKVYFIFGVILLSYLILNQYEHFKNVRNAQNIKQEVLNDCPAHLRTLHMDFLFQNTQCKKYSEVNECSNDQKAFKWEDQLNIQVSQRDLKLGCLNMDCCGIVADRSKFKLNTFTLIHQLIGFGVLTLVMYISQKPPLLNTEIKVYDFVFGLVQLFLVIVAIFLFSKEIGQDINKFSQENVLQINQCSSIHKFLSLDCQFPNCDDIELQIGSDYEMQFYKLSNSKNFYLDDSIKTNLKFYGKFSSIKDYIYNNVYVCVEDELVNFDVSINRHQRLLTQLTSLWDVKFWSITLNLNVDTNYTVQLLNSINKHIYTQDQLKYVQQESYQMIIYCDGYIPHKEIIFVDRDLILNISLIQQNKDIQIILHSNSAMLGATFTTSLYKQYTTTKWMGSNSYMKLKYLNQNTQLISINKVDYPILIFVMFPNRDSYLQIFEKDLELYKTYLYNQNQTQMILCLHGKVIKQVWNASTKILPNSLGC